MHAPLTRTGDFLVIRAERELALAREILEQTRAANDYFREKTALKIVAYYELECELIKHYVEMKTQYPFTALALEEQKPYLAGIWEKADEARRTLADMGSEAIGATSQ